MNLSSSKNTPTDIDIVVLWVDGSDIEWQKRKAHYKSLETGIEQSPEINEASRYRDWGLLKYWFRAIESYAPWARTIHFVTCGQIPAWLNTHHPKLHLVNHSDYIPSEFLPTFSSHTIELNLFRINELSEHFIYFNDDMFLSAPTKPKDFFRHGVPCAAPILTPIVPSIPGHPFVHYLLNDTAVINGHFDLHNSAKANLLKWINLKYGKLVLKNLLYLKLRKVVGFQNFHMPSPMLKSSFQKVWEMEPDILENTCKHRFRAITDVNQYVVSYLDYCEGRFSPVSPKHGRYFSVGEEHELQRKAIVDQKYKYITINDTDFEIDFEKEKAFLIDLFEKAFPSKSAFEL